MIRSKSPNCINLQACRIILPKNVRYKTKFERTSENIKEPWLFLVRPRSMHTDQKVP
jgi:hypothetical protein